MRYYAQRLYNNVTLNSERWIIYRIAEMHQMYDWRKRLEPKDYHHEITPDVIWKVYSS